MVSGLFATSGIAIDILLQSSLLLHVTYPKDQVPISLISEVSNNVENLLFNWNKSYILIGGVSDLGIHIAL
jgi:hypothetical protein